MDCDRGPYGSRRRQVFGVLPAYVLFWFMLFFDAPALAAGYTVSLLPNQSFETLGAAESAMRSINEQTSFLQFKEYVGQTGTVRLYTVPDEPPAYWWMANIGNSGPGPHGGTIDPGGNCESCLQASGGFHWTGVLTPVSPSTPFETIKGCQFTQRDGTIQDTGCVVGRFPSCRSGFALALYPERCINSVTATITGMAKCSISLSGFPAEVEPGKTANDLRAIVTCSGKSPEGIAVTLTPDVVAMSGGHQHDEGRRPQHAGTIGFPNGNVAGADGTVPFTFTAPAPAGDHTVTGRCVDGNCGEDVGVVWVGVRGLQAIGNGPWELTGGRTEHSDNHYLTVPAFLRMQQLALEWRRLYVPFGPVFAVNDASLERGGLFDCCSTYTSSRGVEHDRNIDGWWTPPHQEHRLGTVVDIRANGGPGSIRSEHERDFEKLARSMGADAAIHSAGTGRHYHVRLMGVPE